MNISEKFNFFSKLWNGYDNDLLAEVTALLRNYISYQPI